MRYLTPLALLAAVAAVAASYPGREPVRALAKLPAYCAKLDSTVGDDPPVPVERTTTPSKILAVVRLTNECMLSCTAFAAAPGRFVTAAHCVLPEMTGIRLHFADGKERSAKVLRYGNPDLDATDVAILEGDTRGMHAELEESCKVPGSELLISVGYGRDHEQKATGAVGGHRRYDGSLAYVGFVEEGDSGGPVCSRRGTVVAMQVSYFRDRRHLFAAVPSCKIKEFLDATR